MASKVLIFLFTLWAIGICSSFGIEARNVVITHCDNDNDCLTICKVKFLPKCISNVCICDFLLVCNNDQDCEERIPMCNLQRRCFFHQCICGG
ncbi:hypothetical protein A4A49_10696 [Nicotiana attenuata]|uniref:Uncharacterized protein n=1 Tax=Nicotiana attenuata TaxID=49451 RepID=A0A1J6ITH2_NICAT|nr:hypothetical protein A4A49_10696 [Nicotiana attenuata]